MGKGGFFFDMNVAHSTFLSNTATNGGGGLYIIGAGLSLTITDSAFEANHARVRGGGLVRYDALTAIDRSSFTHNTANDAGGLFLATLGGFGLNPYVTLRDSTISANTANQTAGGVYNQDRAALTNVTLKDNSSG